MPDIQKTVGLSDEEIFTSTVSGMIGTICVRLVLGPLCDMYGPRILMSIVLCGASVATACTGLVDSATGLIILRVFIGFAGGTFVMCQYWTTNMFTKEIVGTANGKNWND
jgi:NNP family nitrate/nitrite transporter-like MFS transporter